MSNDDNWNQEHNQDAFDQHDEAEQYRSPKPGMSTGMKALVVLLCIFGGGGLLCCGGIGFLMYQFFPKISERAEEVFAVQKEIAEIDLPEGIKPRQSMRMDNFMMSMKIAGFESDDSKTTLTLAEFSVKIGGQADQEIQMRQMLREQGAEKAPIVGEKSTSRKLKVKGGEHEFNFATGDEPHTGRKVRRVSGVFPGRKGLAFLMYQTEEDSYKEADVIKMIESIR